jgi:NAD(P)-dependent dehydrogenase (short-subunit alcohol dehydrogenase family)
MPLPAPDFMEFTLPAGRICLLTDDGTATTSKLAQALATRTWPVVVISFPRSVIAERSHLPESVHHIALENMSEAHLEQTLGSIENRHGGVGIFIHLSPPTQTFPFNGSLFLEMEKAIIKHIFLMAKLLKESLNESARQGYGSFMTVGRLDGALGLGNGTKFSATAGGLLGLTKTLNLEWGNVFCRAIDLYPQLDPDRAVQHILAELHDPNRLIVEVGYGMAGRLTLTAKTT